GASSFGTFPRSTRATRMRRRWPKSRCGSWQGGSEAAGHNGSAATAASDKQPSTVLGACPALLGGRSGQRDLSLADRKRCRSPYSCMVRHARAWALAEGSTKSKKATLHGWLFLLLKPLAVSYSCMAN